MSIHLAPLSEENAPAARDLLLRFWRQNWPEDFANRFFRWRYFGRPSCQTMLAFDDTRCVGTIGSVMRSYRMGTDRVRVCETFDWFVLPEYRSLGLGLKLIKRIMARPEPILVIGGTDATRELLPRLGWRRLADVGNYFLPISARTFTALGLRRMLAGSERLARVIPQALRLRNPRKLPAPGASAAISQWSGQIPLGLFPIPDGAYNLAAILDRNDLAWLARAPAEAGQLVVLEFKVNGAPAAISLSRMEQRPEGPGAKILHLQLGTPSTALAEWVVSETAQDLASRGAGVIFCRASCPWISAALRRTGFIGRDPLPAFWWPVGNTIPANPTHLTRLVGDDSIEFVL